MSYEYTTGDEMPPLPPGYHFTVSFTDTLCSQEQLDAIQKRLIEVAGKLIREHDLRNERGGYISTRLAAFRTQELLGEREEALLGEREEEGERESSAVGS